MDIQIASSVLEMSQQAAEAGADAIRSAIEIKGRANIIVATGASQLEMLSILSKSTDLDWQKVVGFHLDEYIGIEFQHSASFRNYLWRRFVSQLPVPMAAFHFLNGEIDAEAECQRVGAILQEHPIDVAFVGIGENAHLAFNDPPADFETRQPYLCVELDEACRQQQTGEGWFPTLQDVPRSAISMSVQQIMQSKKIVCTVPDQRKSQAVYDSLTGPVDPKVPASILQQHPDVTVYLDEPAASRLPKS